MACSALPLVSKKWMVIEYELFMPEDSERSISGGHGMIVPHSLVQLPTLVVNVNVVELVVAI